MPELTPKATGSETALTAVKFTQALSENFVTFAGKLNMFDEFKMPFTGDRLFDGFWNLGMSFPVVVARTLPYSTLGAGAAILKDGVPVFTVMVLDTNNTPTTSGFNTFFSNGATIFANVTLPTKFFGLPGSQGVSGTFSTGNYNSLSPTAYFDPEQGLVITQEFVRDSWCVFYTGTQALWVDPCNPKRAYGVFTNIGMADDGPSPIRFAANVALYGSSPITSRPLDTFGVGYAFTQYSIAGPGLRPAPLADRQRSGHRVVLQLRRHALVQRRPGPAGRLPRPRRNPAAQPRIDRHGPRPRHPRKDQLLRQGHAPAPGAVRTA